jgi:hypothetical protein
MYLLGFFAHALYLGKTVYGDGAYYYAWLSGDPSKFSVGPALFWSPVYFVTHNQFAVGLTSVLAAIFSLILLLDILQKKFGKTVGIATIAAVAGATNLLFYGSLDTVNSHALTFFAVTVFLVLLLARRHWFAVGLALGVVGLMRTQDILFAILLIPVISKKNMLPMLTGFLIAFSPQLFAWYITTGNMFISPYLTGSEGFNFLHPHIFGVLFGTRNGLFLWTPITAIGVAGLVRARKYWMLLVFILELYTVASWSTWWQGASYSGRMFVSSLPILAFGIASIFTWLAKFRWTLTYFILVIIAPLSVMNGISIIYFLLTLPAK